MVIKVTISSDEFESAVAGENEIEQLLRKDPEKAWSLHEIEEEIIGREMNRKKHLDVFIADLTILAPLLFESKKIEFKIIRGIPYFKWK
ncbi:MAG TPA: hypothetical protein VMC42_10150 [Methanoregulaceae archaeon]|nr:hypothetical protein [Methanoregulaceae archaeon]